MLQQCLTFCPKLRRAPTAALEAVQHSGGSPAGTGLAGIPFHIGSGLVGEVGGCSPPFSRPPPSLPRARRSKAATMPRRPAPELHERWVLQMLRGLSDYDPAGLDGAAGVPILAAISASLILSVKPARGDPAVALRHV